MSKKMIIEFPARLWKWHTLFDLLRVTSLLALLKSRVVAIDVVQSEPIQTSSQLIT